MNSAFDPFVDAGARGQTFILGVFSPQPTPCELIAACYCHLLLPFGIDPTRTAKRIHHEEHEGHEE